MTITSSNTAPLFVVVGSTGSQGRSVIDAIAADKKEYRVRAITRDPTKTSAQELEGLGCEVVAADADDADSIERALQGAEIVFGVTVSDYWSPDGEEKERNQGKVMADAAKKVGAKVFIWSGMPNHATLTNGRRPLWIFDLKAEVTDYARSLGGIRVIDVQPGSFASNYWTHAGPRQTQEKTYILPLAFEENTRIPIIDIAADFGRYAIGALNNGVDTVIAASEYITPIQAAEQYSMIAGQTISYVRVPDDQMYEAMKGGGDKLARTMVTFAHNMQDPGYYGGADLEPSQKVLDYPARTFAQALEGNKTEVLKQFQE